MKKKPKITKQLRTKVSPKKTPQRKPEKLWGLEPLTFPKSAQEYIDIDEQYKKDLKNDPKAAAFLSKFHEEVYGNKFKKGSGNRNLYSKGERKSIYDSTNARNRDMYNKRYKYLDIEYLAGLDAGPNADPTDAVLNYIDKKKRVKKFLDEAVQNGLSVKEAEELTKYVFDLEI